MKLFCVVLALAFVVCAQALSDELKEKIKKTHDECIKETGADEELIKKLEHAQYTGNGEDLKCFPKCFYLKAGFMNDKGEILIDAMKEMIKDEKEKEKMEEVIDKCNEKTGTDPCNTAFLSMKCWKEHIVKKD